MNILIGMTGSVASTLASKIVESFQHLGNVRLVLTSSAMAFVPSDMSMTTGKQNNLEVFTDKNEWEWEINPLPAQGGRFRQATTRGYYEKGDKILHIELRRWADVFVIAPLSANTLAKIAHGLCDNLLTSIVRAWDDRKQIVLAPSMNMMMWSNPITRRHLSMLFARQMNIVDPQSKHLACGDVGEGAMADINYIVKRTEYHMRWRYPLFSSPVGGIPQGDHPGAFGYKRKHDIHTGVDLYTQDGASVQAMEHGTVLKVIPFTGSKVFTKDGKPMDWWLDTEAVLIAGPSGVIVYGEVKPHVKEGDQIAAGQIIANVIPVLKPGKERSDIPGHSRSMLHIELYSQPYGDLERFVWEGWELEQPKPEFLLDPTKKLIDLFHHIDDACTK